MTHKNSILDAGWLAATMAQCPATLLPDGNIRGGPMRLSFPAVDVAIAPDLEKPDKKKFMAMLLAPRGADMTLYQSEAYKAAQKQFPNLDQPGGPTTAMLEWPFNDQAKKAHLEPFEAGNIFFSTNANEDRRPLLVDLRGAPIPNVKEKFYSGCWVLPLLNAYGWDYKNAQGATLKRGVSFGLTGLIWLADDTTMSGGSVDVQGAVGGLGNLAPPPGQLSGFGGADPSAMFTATPTLMPVPGVVPASPFAGAAPAATPSMVPGLPSTSGSPVSPAAMFPSSPPAAPPPPPPVAAKPVLLNGGDYDAHIAQGWTDALLRQHGMMA